MTAKPSPQDQEIIEILKRLETLKAEYPLELLAARRAAFIAQIEEREAEANEASDAEVQVAEALGSLKNVDGQYPADLFTARRSAFLAQVKQQKEMRVKEEFLSRARVIQVLESLKNTPAEYPPELFAARREAFIAQIDQHNAVEVSEDAFAVQNGKLLALFNRLKSAEIKYPLQLWATRRAAFLRQVSRESVSILDALRSAIQSFIDQIKTPQAPLRRLARSSLILAGLLLAAIVGSLFYSNQDGNFASHPLAQNPGNASQPLAAATNTQEPAKVICKPGYLPPLCLAQEFDKTQDLSFAGNGSARPAVAKDTLPGFDDIHRASYVNDGLYGAGASWISNSAYSWIKIDLGKPTEINTITFGRDRLGNYNDRDPGQFVIAVALSDNIYADGNSSNDDLEYQKIYDSKNMGFDGVVKGSETVEADFAPVEARYVKITFQNSGTAIDEIEAFMVQPTSFAYGPTDKHQNNQPRPTWTPVPTDTLIPSKTPTPVPTNTWTPVPTNTPLPTSTPLPTDTPTLVPTDTATDLPTNTPRPTRTPTPYPTDTPVPPTDTSVSPTDTSAPPTDTSAPPTDTPAPALADTTIPATDTAVVIP